MYDMPLSAASGTAGSVEANTKGLLDVWDCSSNLHCSPLPFWNVAYPSLLSLTLSRESGSTAECVPQVLKIG